MNESDPKRNDWIAPALLAISFFVGYGLHTFTGTPVNNDADPSCISKYPLLRDDLDCTNANDNYDKMKGLEASLSDYVNTQITNKNATRISVFVRDLNSRRWIGLNDKEIYSPGSLLKLPLAVAYFKLSEMEPGVLKQEFVFRSGTTSMNDVESYKPSEKLIQGNTYGVLELIEHMLKYSDNDAIPPLADSINQDFLKKVFADLGTTLPASGGGEQNFLSADTYASIFRQLYLGSYLSIDDSEQLLETLTRTTFKDGIMAGIPDKGITVAHKFGEREVSDKSTGKRVTAELHDCGVVYKPNNPYIICVMTEGTDVKTLAPIIGEISKMVFGSE